MCVHIDRHTINEGIDVPDLDAYFYDPLEVSTIARRHFGINWRAFCAFYRDGLFPDSAIETECILFRTDDSTGILLDVRDGEASVTSGAAQ